MFSLFKKNIEDSTNLYKETNELIDAVARHNELNKHLNSITISSVDIQNKKDFVEHFKSYLGNPLSIDDFLDINYTKQLKHRSYKYIFSHHTLSVFMDEYVSVINELSSLKKETFNYYNKDVAVFHDYDGEIGAIKMTLGKFWSLFPRILNVLDAELHHDLLVVATNFSFGICVEIEGNDYSMTTWGLDSTNPRTMNQSVRYMGDRVI